MPVSTEGYTHVFNQYVIRVKERDELKKYLAEHNIGAEIYYPVPLHLQKCFEYLGYHRGDFPISEEAAGDSLALPVYPELTDEMQEYVVDRIASFYH